MEREGGRSLAWRKKEKLCCCVSVNLLMLVGAEPQMLELLQYALVHHMIFFLAHITDMTQLLDLLIPCCRD